VQSPTDRSKEPIRRLTLVSGNPRKKYSRVIFNLLEVIVSQTRLGVVCSEGPSVVS